MKVGAGPEAPLYTKYYSSALFMDKRPPTEAHDPKKYYCS